MDTIRIVPFHYMIIKLICSNNNTRLILTSVNPERSSNRLLKDTRIIESGIKDSRNSTIIFQLTTGMVGLKGATRSSIYGGENLYKKFIERLKEAKLYNNTFILLVKGFGPTRHFLLHKLAQLKINKIKDITSYPHNGCRLPKSLRK
jgi:ribosomal protein S11